MARTSPSYVAARLYLMFEALCNGEIYPDPTRLSWTTDFLDTFGLPGKSKADQYKTLVAARLYLKLAALCNKEIRPSPAQLEWATNLFDTLSLPDEILNEAEADHCKMLDRRDNFCPTCGAGAVVGEKEYQYCPTCGEYSEW